MAAKSVPIERRNPHNSQIKSYTEAVRRGQKSYHVVHSSGKWEVKRIGADSVVGRFRTKGEAARRAMEIAKRDKTEVFVHNRAGLVEDRHSYETDPYPPRG